MCPGPEDRLKVTFCGRNALDARVLLNRLAECASEGLEHGLGHMVCVAAIGDPDVQGHPGLGHKGFEEVLDKVRLERLYLLFPGIDYLA